jgi:hypothetical protein
MQPGWLIPIATFIIIGLATLFPTPLARLQTAGEAAGVLCMQVLYPKPFFARILYVLVSCVCYSRK